MFISNMGFYQNFNIGMYQQPAMNFPVYNFSNFNTNFNFQINFYKQDFNYFAPQNFNNKITFNTFNYTFGSAIDTSKTKSKTKKTKKEISYDAEALKANWKNKKPNLTDKFYSKVVQISKRLKCNPDELMGVMNSESGINHKAVNEKSNATGLIQFMPDTARSLGTTTEKLKNMTAVEQLDYVEKYLEKQKKAAGFSNDEQLSAGELYALVFLPGRANRSVLTSQGEKYYSWNKGLDRNKDGKITVAELDTRVKKDFMA